jgi:hypothetical protein
VFQVGTVMNKSKPFVHNLFQFFSMFFLSSLRSCRRFCTPGNDTIHAGIFLALLKGRYRRGQSEVLVTNIDAFPCAFTEVFCVNIVFHSYQLAVDSSLQGFLIRTAVTVTS